MGIDYTDARVLLAARNRGVSFQEVLTIGHLSLKLRLDEIADLKVRFQSRYSGVPLSLQSGSSGYSDDLFREVLGTSRLTVMDYSGYEGAQLIHDLNCPVPEGLRGRFDAVIDGGTLEHIFNFPVAISSLMAMVKVGGYLFIKSPANNMCGHGFYQFSPEVMFRVLSEHNGFEATRVLLVERQFPSVELTPQAAIYEVIDPEKVDGRVGLVSKRPVVMIVESRKTKDVPIVSALQSDYVAAWSATGNEQATNPVARAIRDTFTRLPSVIRARIAGYRELRRYSFSNRRFYRRCEL